MDVSTFSGLGLEPMLTTSALVDYLGVRGQAIYDLRADHRGPSGIRVGREIRYRVCDVLRWLDGLSEHEPGLATSGEHADGRPPPTADWHVRSDHDDPDRFPKLPGDDPGP